uniref:Uncharacterized protein n=1 Tax=Photinus pyralis TaxID=7054 RepID=A0A1Y1LU69_PHOPY
MTKSPVKNQEKKMCSLVSNHHGPGKYPTVGCPSLHQKFFNMLEKYNRKCSGSEFEVRCCRTDKVAVEACPEVSEEHTLRNFERCGDKLRRIGRKLEVFGDEIELGEVNAIVNQITHILDYIDKILRKCEGHRPLKTVSVSIECEAITRAVGTVTSNLELQPKKSRDISSLFEVRRHFRALLTQKNCKLE